MGRTSLEVMSAQLPAIDERGGPGDTRTLRKWTRSAGRSPNEGRAAMA
ncbi:MAG: hypothetical protein WD358_02605 [Nitriliruptoraceae bacterium]